jgi:hypothetical protein
MIDPGGGASGERHAGGPTVAAIRRSHRQRGDRPPTASIADIVIGSVSASSLFGLDVRGDDETFLGGSHAPVVPP